jgi:hypothetical protein
MVFRRFLVFAICRHLVTQTESGLIKTMTQSPQSRILACHRTARGATKVNPVSVYTPELITLEKHEKSMQSLRDQIEHLRRPALGRGRDKEESDDD